MGLRSGSKESLRDLDPKSERWANPNERRLTLDDPDIALSHLQADGLDIPGLDNSVYDRAAPALSRMLDTRMLFSALVDADYIETEAHFAGDGEYRYRTEVAPLDLDSAIEELARYTVALSRDASPEVQAVRDTLLKTCLDAALSPAGLFTLTAPTGSGKTLAMLAFALEHARHHGLRRVVVAIPYLSIIEQTARVYRCALGDEFVLEQHGLAAPPSDEIGLHADNWDAPLVVTTHVQLLESLFANNSRRCRKLHRLADSVVLFDEVQLLPPELAVPTLAALSHLSRRYRASVVFATATQPAFDTLHGRVSELAATGWRPREIVAGSAGMFDRLRRVDVSWELERPVSWNKLRKRLLALEQVLCVVNLKRHAIDLAELLRGTDGLFHLSTNMCPVHRQQVLAAVRVRLDSNRTCRLVSTQCVEAGVDVDFPTVFRALGPLDSIAQAAGRCNRAGKLPSGSLVVFVPEDEGYPGGAYTRATSVTRMLIADGADLHDPATYRKYYQLYYELTKVTDGESGRARRLTAAIRSEDYERCADEYRIIATDSIRVLVGFDPARYRALAEEARGLPRPSRDWVLKAQLHAVNLYRSASWNNLEPVPASASPEQTDWFIHLAPDLYDATLLGLREAEEAWIA